MKITMLGISGSGKTVYMSAMSELFFNSSVQGYTIANREENYESAVFVNRGFERINTLSEGKFPDGTTNSIIMPLELRYRGERVIDIDWIDYRGGAIKELSLGDNNEYNAEIYATLIASDIIMVFVDAARLKAYKNNTVARKQLGAIEISQMLTLVSRKKHVDVIFLLSKADSSTVNIENEYKMLKARVGEIYARFLSETNTIIEQYPVLAIGAIGCGNVLTNLESSSGNAGIYTFEHFITDTENMYTLNIAASFATALLKCLESETNKVNTTASLIEKELTSLKNRFGPVKNIIDILFNKSAKREFIYDLEQEILAERREISRLESHKERLQRIALGSL